MYRDHPVLHGYREAVLEMLFASLWLYEDFPPDVHLFVSTADEPHGCELEVPFLQFSVLANDTASLESPDDAVDFTKSE